MRIFKLVLISFFLITSANSNSIYNLIKIPNLEIYQLKTPNKLKYFYATKPFRLGVQKNIICNNSDKKTYDKVIFLFDDLMRVLHPFMPFITEEIWQLLLDRKEGESIMVSQMPSIIITNSEIIDSFEDVKNVAKQKYLY